MKLYKKLTRVFDFGETKSLNLSFKQGKLIENKSTPSQKTMIYMVIDGLCIKIMKVDGIFTFKLIVPELPEVKTTTLKMKSDSKYKVYNQDIDDGYGKLLYKRPIIVMDTDDVEWYVTEEDIMDFICFLFKTYKIINVLNKAFNVPKMEKETQDEV